MQQPRIEEPEALRIVVLDADRSSRQEVAATLQSSATTVIGEAADASAARDLAGPGTGSVIFVAVSEPIDDACVLMAALGQASPEARLIAYSAHRIPRLMPRLAAAGVWDWLTLPLDRHDVERVLRAANEPAQADTATSTLLTVIGVKGGVGKTTVATNLAAAIAHDTERSVLLVDLDSRFGDLAVSLDLKPRGSIVDLARAVDAGLTAEAVEESLTLHESGIRVLAAPRHPSEWGQVTPEQLQAILGTCRGLFDYVILDTPGAYTELVATAIEEADRVLLLSSLERTSLKNTRAMLEILDTADGRDTPIELIFNQVHASGSLTAEAAAALVSCSRYEEIPYDERVLRANALGSPFVLTDPSSPAARQIRQIAARVAPADAAAFQRHDSVLTVLAPWLRRWRHAA